MNKYETEIMANWHSYSSNGGALDFETFYKQDLTTQARLVRVRKWGVNRLLRGF
jgi:hypothetical protein|tara:strand:+ start:175 stop:336 length:162 start_codon:yes stop_codon:yes gene_type:complete